MPSAWSSSGPRARCRHLDPVNSLLPHQLNAACSDVGARSIHVSTDCVFSGRGRSATAYTEADEPDPLDLYGRSKLLGETGPDGARTLRTSIIGWELRAPERAARVVRCTGGRPRAGLPQRGLLGSDDPGPGAGHPDRPDEHRHLRGLYHVASEPISKFDLLTCSRHARDQCEIEPYDEPIVNRALDGDRFARRNGHRGSLVAADGGGICARTIAPEEANRA